jgi:solute carrier family 35 protein F1/2
VKAFEFTSITSVMLLQVFSIPCALLLSITFLKVKYSRNHYIALLFCAGGVTFSVINDLIMHPRASEGEEEGYGEKFNWDAFIGDLMVLTSSVMFAS